MTDRVFAPGEKEREEIDERFREICSYAKLPHPLPEKFCNTAEIGIYGNLCDDFRRYREKAISKEILIDRIQSHKTAHRNEYRSMRLKDEIYRKDQERFKLHSQTLAWLNKCDENTVTLDEWESAIFTVLGCEYTEVEEKRLRRKWEIIRQRYREGDSSAPGKPKKAKKEAERHKYGAYKNVLLSDSELGKLKEEFPQDFEERIEALSIYIASSGKTYKSHLATIRNWARRDAEKQKEAAAKNAASAASYDIEKFESLENIVGVRYAGEN